MTANGRSRDVRIDSATGVLITLVVLGHMLATMHGGAAHAALFWIYMFHMPAFVFVSGYVTRYVSKWSPVDIVTRLLFPYIVFALIQRLLDAWWNDEPFELRPLSVPWTLWYLLALMVWRLLAPLMQKMSFAVGVPVAVALSILGAGIAWIGQAYSLGRIVGLLPFFVAGLLWRPEWWDWALSRWMRIVAAVVLLASAVWSVFNHRTFPRSAFLFSKDHEALGITAVEGMIDRAGVLLVAGTLAFCVIVHAMRALPVMPGIGIASLSVYLLHGVVLFPWHEDGAPNEFAGGWAVIVAALLSFGIAWLLSRRLVITATRPLMDFRWWRSLASKKSARTSP